MLARKVEAGACAAEVEAAAVEQAESEKEQGFLEQVMASPVVRDIARTAGREIARSIFGAGRRR